MSAADGQAARAATQSYLARMGVRVWVDGVEHCAAAYRDNSKVIVLFSFLDLICAAGHKIRVDGDSRDYVVSAVVPRMVDGVLIEQIVTVKAAGVP